MVTGSRSIRSGFVLALAAAIVLPGLAGAPAFAQEAPAPSSAETPAPAETALARAIRAESRGEVREFYARRGYWPLWIEDGRITPAADSLLAMLESADIDGLDPGDYDPRDVERAVERSRDGTPQSLARAEIALSRALARYAGDLARPSGEIAYYDETLRSGAGGEGEVLRRAALAEDFEEYIATMGWMSPYYSGLREAVRARSGPGSDESEFNQVVIYNGELLRRGDQGLRVVHLRRRLGLSEGDRFDAELHIALTDFQRARGLTPDGVLGPQTVAALNSSVRPHDDRLLQRNLARARELPGPWTRHIVVNVAEQRLSFFGEGREQGSMKVVVGTPETPTPMMAGMLSHATLNPYWNVPVSLVERTIAPAVVGGASLREMGYEVLSDWTANARVLDPATVDWEGAAAGRTQLRVRELPGSGNAMGSVKYMFPNDLGIYLHDTDNRALFGREERFFSNGCVRLEDAEALGRWLFGDMPQQQGSQPEQHVPLPQPVPVYITYLTAVPQANGAIAYLEDVYDRDRGPVRVAAR